MEIDKKYSLVKDHDDHFELHDSSDNKKFKVHKKHIHPATQIRLMKMQKFDEGGEVEGFDSGLSKKELDSYDKRGWLDNYIGDTSYETPAPSTKVPIDMNNYITPTEPVTVAQNEMPQISAPGAENPPRPQAHPATQQSPQINPMAGFPTVGSLNSMQGQYEKALKQGAQGQIDQNQQIANLYQPKIDAQERAMTAFQDNMDKYKMMAEKMAADLSDPKSNIDSNRFWHEKSTGQKWLTALGVLGSGIGAGLQGHGAKNMAMEVLQGEIDRDIEAQKANLGKKQTLLSDNFRAQGNMIAAENATRAQYEAMFQGKLAQLTAKTNNPMIMADAQQKIMDSRVRMMQYLQPVAQNQMVMQLRDQLNKGGVQGQDPSQYVPYLVPEARQAEVFKEIKAAQDINSLAPKIMDAFKRGSSRNPVVAAQGQREFEGLINTTITEQEGTARQAAFDSVHRTMTPSGMSALPGENEAKERTILNYLSSKSSAPVARGFGIDLKKFGSTVPVSASPAGVKNGATASDSHGNRIVMQNGKWVPYK